MPILRPEERVGSVLAQRYRLDRILGKGGMGVVFAGTHTWTNRPIAVKLLLPQFAEDSGVLQRFFQEARAAAALKHPHVIDVIDMGEDEGGDAFIVLEFLDGEPMSALMKRDGALDFGALLEIVLPVMDALAEAHTQGILHRDLKPDNLYLAKGLRGRKVPKLLDFGIAKLLESQSMSTGTGGVLGTPHYMAPEQARGDKDLDARADIWSMGIVCFQALSGKLPFVAETPTVVLVQIMTKPAPPLRDVAPNVHPAVAAVVDRALAADRNERFASIAEMMTALIDAAATVGIELDSRLLEYRDREAPAGPATRQSAAGKAAAGPPVDPSAPTQDLLAPNAPAAPVPASVAAAHQSAAVTANLRPVAAAEIARDPRPPAEPPPQAPAAIPSAQLATLPDASPVTRPFDVPAQSSVPVFRPLPKIAEAAPAPQRSRGLLYAALGCGALAVVGTGGFGAMVCAGSTLPPDETTQAPTFPETAQSPTVPAATGPEPTSPTTPVATPTPGTPAPSDGDEDMIRFAGGTIRMGSTHEEAAQNQAACLAEASPRECAMPYFGSEQPARSATVGAFAIDRTEVSNAMFARWLAQQPGVTVGANTIDGDRLTMATSQGSWLAAVQRPGCSDRIGLVEANGVFGVRPGYEQQPVIFVTWSAANQYCRSRRRTLPSEAQWELAAGAGVRRFIVTNDPPPCDAVVRGRYRGGPCATAQPGPQPIGTTVGDTTPEGVRDLAGNVAEWVDDLVQGTPQNDCGAQCRAVRGGDYESLLDRLRARARYVGPEDGAYETVGFRCAQSL